MNSVFHRLRGRGRLFASLARLAQAVGLVAIAATSAHAQTSPGEPDPSLVRARLGPLYMNPAISLTNMGIDTNVFNEPDELNPKRDFTFTVEPKVDLWLRLGRTWLNGAIGEQVVWFQKYPSERNSNTNYRLGWTAPLNRMLLSANAAYVHTRERPGYEIDARAQRTQPSFDGSAEFRFLARTYFGARASRSRVKFADHQFYQGRDLQRELNRTSTGTGLTVRNQLTPLTSLTMDVSRIEDRFEFRPERDSNSTSITGGVKFDPFALLKGGATFGYRNFKPNSSEVPPFKGLTVAVDLTYVLLGSTRFNVQVNRDISYSYDLNQPYYLLSGVTGSIAQQLFGPVDVVGRGSYQTLSYRNRVGAIVLVADRIDHAQSFGAGLGYHAGRDVRIGFNVDRASRRSEVKLNQYSGLRFGVSVTYGT